jgi:hypothetical protein
MHLVCVEHPLLVTKKLAELCKKLNMLLLRPTRQWCCSRGRFI